MIDRPGPGLRRTLRTPMRLLPPRFRRGWLALVPLLVVTTAAELLTAAVIYEFVADLSDDGISSRAVAIVVAVSLLRAILLWALARFQSRLTTASIAAAFRALLAGYLAAPYELHAGRSPAEGLQRLTTAIDVAYRLVMGSAAGLLGEALVAAALTAYLFVVAPPAAASVAIALVGAGALTLTLARSSVAEWGRRQYEAGEETLRELHDVFGGMREIRTAHAELPALERVSGVQQRFAEALRKHLVALANPRIVMETAFALVAVVVILIVPPPGVVPLLALFAWLALRLIPAANRAVYHLDHIRHGAHAVGELEAALCETGPFALARRPRREVAFRDAIVLDRVSYAYPGAASHALSEVTLAIRQGEWVGLAGSNGSGKTTLLEVIAGLRAPSGGTIRIDGRSVEEWQATDPPLFGYVPQRPHAPGDEAKRRSGGERQQAALARAIAYGPEILLLDEPTTALDEAEQRRFASALAAMRGRASMILVSHDPQTLSLCDRVVTLEGGAIADERDLLRKVRA